MNENVWRHDSLSIHIGNMQRYAFDWILSPTVTGDDADNRESASIRFDYFAAPRAVANILFIVCLNGFRLYGLLLFSPVDAGSTFSGENY